MTLCTKHPESFQIERLRLEVRLETEVCPTIVAMKTTEIEALKADKAHTQAELRAVKTDLTAAKAEEHAIKTELGNTRAERDGVRAKVNAPTENVAGSWVLVARATSSARIRCWLGPKVCSFVASSPLLGTVM